MFCSQSHDMKKAHRIQSNICSSYLNSNIYKDMNNKLVLQSYWVAIIIKDVINVYFNGWWCWWLVLIWIRNSFLWINDKFYVHSSCCINFDWKL